jgi:hypothetical protein
MIAGMTTCTDCNLEMATARGCTLSQVTIKGAQYARHGCTRRRCGDCGATPGGFHHLGCDLERCPRCGRQLISCGCLDDDDEDEDDEDA